MDFILGHTALNFLEKRKTDAMNKTTIGIMDMANASTTNEGGQSFVNKKMAIKDKKLPITGKADESAVFCYADTTAVSTFTII